MITELRDLDAILPPLEMTEAPSIEKGQNVISRWKKSLVEIVNELSRKDYLHPLVAAGTAMSIENWETHPDHGALHDYFVYEGMNTLDRMEGTFDPTNDSMKQAGAVLHDYGQLLPGYKSPVAAVPFDGNFRAAHANIMAELIYMFGRKLGLKASEVDDLAISVRRHDDVYKGIKHPHLSYSGQLLSDADKLFGAGLETDPLEMMAASLVRNRKGSYKPEGWYLLRDLTPEQRTNWRYGHRWLADSVTAALHDTYGLTYYTGAAARLDHDKQKVFEMAANRYYSKLFDDHAQMIKEWEQIPYAPVQLVGFQQQPKVYIPHHDISEIIDHAYSLPFFLPDNYSAEGYESAGWMVQVVLPDERLLIDPSIARFATRPNGRQQFLARINGAIEIAKTW